MTYTYTIVGSENHARYVANCTKRIFAIESAVFSYHLASRGSRSFGTLRYRSAEPLVQTTVCRSLANVKKTVGIVSLTGETTVHLGRGIVGPNGANHSQAPESRPTTRP